MIAWLLTGILTGTISHAALATWRRSRRLAWRTVFDFHRREGHILPLHDLVEHPEDEDCICGPTCEAHQCEDGGTSWLYIHHSLDGREMGEQRGSVA